MSMSWGEITEFVPGGGGINFTCLAGGGGGGG